MDPELSVLSGLTCLIGHCGNHARAVVSVLDAARAFQCRVALFGGAVLDAATFGGLPRDLDFVVQSRPGWEPAFAERMDRAGRTELGGLRGEVHSVQTDVWSLESTRGFRDLGLEPSFENLPRTAFFNANAVAVEVGDGEVLKKVHEAGFYDFLRTRTLEVVNPLNEFAGLQAMKTARLVSKGFTVGESLADWLVGQRVRRARVERLYSSFYGGDATEVSAVSRFLVG